MADDRSNTLGTLNDLLFQELERLNGADLEDEDAIKREVERAYGEGVMSVPIALDESQWVKLPVDADGAPIHIGDVMEWSNGSFTVHELKLTEDGWQTWDSEHGYTVHADECIRHHQPDSWERIIADAVKNGMYDHDNERIQQKLVERCRRLAGEGA